MIPKIVKKNSQHWPYIGYFCCNNKEVSYILRNKTEFSFMCMTCGKRSTPEQEKKVSNSNKIFKLLGYPCNDYLS